MALFDLLLIHLVMGCIIVISDATQPREKVPAYIRKGNLGDVLKMILFWSWGLDSKPENSKP